MYGQEKINPYEQSGQNAHGHRSVRDDHAFRHQGTGPDDAVFAHHAVVQQGGVHPDQAVIAHCTAVDDGPVPNGYPLAHLDIQPGACVQYGVILHIGVFADGDAARIGAQHRTVPDAALLRKAHTARQRRILRYKRRTAIGGGAAIDFDICHIFPSRL